MLRAAMNHRSVDVYNFPIRIGVNAQVYYGLCKEAGQALEATSSSAPENGVIRVGPFEKHLMLGLEGLQYRQGGAHK